MTAKQVRNAARRFCMATGIPPDELQSGTHRGKRYTRPAWWFEREKVKRAHAMLFAIVETLEQSPWFE
jgi:hypothetical protein